MVKQKQAAISPKPSVLCFIYNRPVTAVVLAALLTGAVHIVGYFIEIALSIQHVRLVLSIVLMCMGACVGVLLAALKDSRSGRQLVAEALLQEWNTTLAGLNIPVTKGSERWFASQDVIYFKPQSPSRRAPQLTALAWKYRESLQQ